MIDAKKCKYYIEPKNCSHWNKSYELGECLYKNGVITKEAEIHCSQNKNRESKTIKIEI